MRWGDIIVSESGWLHAWLIMVDDCGSSGVALILTIMIVVRRLSYTIVECSHFSFTCQCLDSKVGTYQLIDQPFSSP